MSDVPLSQDGAVKEVKDLGTGPQAVVKLWLLEWETASKQEEDWRKAARDVVKQYRSDNKRKGSHFNILWSNTEIMRPSLYNQTPKADVRRRFRDEDPVGKEIAEVLERGLEFSLDAYDFDGVMVDCVDDYMLPGRGVARVRYEPSFETITPEPRFPDRDDFDLEGRPLVPINDDGVIKEEPFERLVDQRVTCEHWDWECFRRGPGRKWGEVPWIGFEHRLTEKEGKDEFGADWEGVQLDFSTEEKSDNKEPTIFSRARVYEIWHKEKREVIWIAPSKKEAPLRTEQDSLNLEDFYPVPRPLYAIKTTDTLVPVEEYRLYRDQAEELDKITQRISRLISALKARGAYDATLKELGRIFSEDDSAMIPLEDSLAAVQASGGLENSIWFLPIERIAQVLAGLYQQREQIKQTIFEITGLSDILRGATDPNETLGAQQLKAQTGSLRLQRRQREVQRFARDLIRLKAEIIAEQFTPEMLQIMTGRQVTPEMTEIMRVDTTRAFRIDIETDSTIAADQETDKRNITELLTAVTGYIAQAAPAVQAGFMPVEAAKGLLLSAVRRFKLGREVEDALETVGQQGEEQEGPSPEEQAAQAQQQQLEIESQIQQAEARSKADGLERKDKLDELKHTFELEKLKREKEQNRREHEVKMLEFQMKEAVAREASRQSAE